MKEKVEEVIESIRPMLMADGGNVELVEVTKDGVVKLRLTGACGVLSNEHLYFADGHRAPSQRSYSRNQER
jgi:hypothetical protein